MKTLIKSILFVIFFVAVSCSESKDPIIGAYSLEVSEFKNVTSGHLEIVGEPEDYFGRITFNAKRPRVYEIGLAFKSEDSLHFRLPGANGYLSLQKRDSLWQGSFKYFGIQASLTAKKTGEPS